MKKIFTLFLLFASIVLRAQETPPSGSNFKTLPTYSFKYYTPDSSVWIYKGTTYGWTKIGKLPDMSLYAPLDDPSFTTKITTPALNIPTSAAVNYFWKCTDAGTGAGTWAAVSTSQVYKGTWNATTNSPTLADGSGTAGWYYRCTTGGTVDFGHGNITFGVGDDANYNGTIWQRVPVGASQWITTGSDIYYNGGRVRIGGITASYTLHVEASVAANWAAYIYNSNATGDGLLVKTNNTVSTEAIFGAYSNGMYRFWIGNNGYIGVNTTTPGQLFQVNGEVGILNGNNFIQYCSGNATYWNPHPSSTSYVWNYNGSNVMTLTSSGALDAASTVTATGGNSTQWNTAYTHSQIAGGTGVHISGTERTNWNTAYGWGNWASNFGTTSGTITQGNDSRVNNGQTAYGWGNHASAGYALLNSSPTFTGSITATNFILSSDRRLKTNIRPISDLSKFSKVVFVQFNMKSEPGQLRYGVIAQSVEKIAPELVRTDSSGMKSVAYVDLLCGKVVYLENRINHLNHMIIILFGLGVTWVMVIYIKRK